MEILTKIPMKKELGALYTVHKKTELPVDGIIQIRRMVSHWKNGEVQETYFEDPLTVHNKVVNNGRNYYARKTAGVITNYITNLKMGTDNTPTTLGDIDLRSPVWPLAGADGAFDSFTFPATGQVTFVKKVTGNSFGQEYIITEMSAHFNDGSLMDRALVGQLPVHPTNTDGVEVGLIVEWSVIF